MQTFVQDLKYAFRNLKQAPGFAAVAIITLALGIGANSAIFSVVNGVVIKPLEYDDPGELVFIQTGFPNIGFDEFWISAPEYLQYRDASRSYESMGVFNTGEVSLTGGESPIRVSGGFATATLFTTLGVEAMLGRTFTAEEDSPGGDPAAILSYELWTRAFGAREGITGETVEVNGVTRTVVGVMPPRFDLDDNGVEIWLPLAFDEANPPSWGGHNYLGVGRLADGLTMGQARAELDTLHPQWEEARPDSHTNRVDVHEVIFKPLRTRVVGDVEPLLLTLLGAVGFVLLIAVANVGNLLLARAESRQKEIAVRTALGAGRARLLRQFVTESVVLALIGGLVGLVVGRWGLEILLATNPQSIPRLNEIGLDMSVLGFTLVIAIVTGILFGLAPMLHLTLDSLRGGLREGGERATAGSARHRLRQSLVIVEIAGAVVLVVGAGLMLRSFSTLLSVDPGFEPQGMLSFRMFLPPPMYPNATDHTVFYRELQNRLEVLPGVERASMMSGLPPIRRINANTMEFEGIERTDDGPPLEVDYWQFVMDGYFETMKIPLVEGRLFVTEDEGSTLAVGVVNKTMADMYWREGALGRRVRPCCGDSSPWITVVGVVADVKQGGMDTEAGSELYFYAPQVASMGFGMNTMNIVLRTTVPPESLAPQARQAVWSLDSALPLADVQTMESAVFSSMARPRFLTLLLGTFGAVALMLAAVGTYGVMSFFVAERSREMGIRMALGAESGGVIALVLGQGLRIVIVGLVLGVGGALLLARFVESMLFGVTPLDLTTYIGVPALLALVAVAACLIPAWRATRVDPMVVLKAE